MAVKKKWFENEKFSNLLKNLSNISQLGLLLLAIFGYFYTVKPLYSKALLEEQTAEKEIELRKLGTDINKLKSELVSGQKELQNVRNMANEANESLLQTTSKLNIAEQKVRTKEKELGVAEQKVGIKEKELGIAENKLIDNYKLTKPAALSAFRDDIRTCTYRTLLSTSSIGLDEETIKELNNCTTEKTYNSLYVRQLAANDKEIITKQVDKLVEKMRTEGGSLVNDYLKRRNELINNKTKESSSDEAKHDSIETKRNAIREKLKNDLLTINLTGEYVNKIQDLFFNEVDKIEI